MKICFIILTHKHPDQLERLVKRLSTPETSFVIHVDKKSDINVFLDRFKENNSVYFAKQVSCAWGDFSLIQATINCIHTIIQNNIPYDYAIMMSGQDYPIKTNKYINDFFEYSDDNLYLEFFNEQDHTKHWQKLVFDFRLKHYFTLKNNIWYALTDNHEVLKEDSTTKKWEIIEIVDKNEIFDSNTNYTFPRTLPNCIFETNNEILVKTMVSWGGSQWWAFTKEVVEFIYKFLNDNPGYVDFHKNTYIPDEIFFQTIILNHPEFSERAINHRLRFIDWSREIKPMIFDNSYQKLFEDFIDNQPFYLFARKFDSPQSLNLQTQIDMILDRKNAIEQISNHVFQYNEVNDNSEIKTQPAIDLLFNPLRFDLLIKYLFAKSIANNEASAWIEELYIQHILYFNNFSEDNFPEKKEGYDFVHAFKKLIDLYKIDKLPVGLRTIPIGEDNCPLDGAHRLAILAAKNKDVATVQLSKKFPLTHYAFNYDFFVKKGMPEKYTDFIALEYCRLCPDSYMMCIFPSCFDAWTEIDIMIKKNSSVYYEKEVSFSDVGKWNFIINLYRNEPWITNTESVKWKMNECFKSGNSVKIYLLYSSKLEKIKDLKQEIRDLSKIGNHSVHSTDHRDTTFELASMVFNKNTIDYINSYDYSINLSNFIPQFKSYKKYLENNNLDQNLFCIDGSAILSACNLRDCYDLDFLYYGDYKLLTQTPNKVDCHNHYFSEEMKYDKIFDISINDIITNPINYFYYEGYKVMHPSLIKKFKEYRNEKPKDTNDVYLINLFEEKIEKNTAELTFNDNRNSSWYPQFETLLRKKSESNIFPKIYLNARLNISANTITKYKDWLFNNNLSTYKIDFAAYFYTFELFQLLDSKFEKSFFEVAEYIIKEKKQELNEDFFMFLRLCFTSYIISQNNSTLTD